LDFSVILPSTVPVCFAGAQWDGRFQQNGLSVL